MVKIRLKRLGRKKRPFYRIVVMDVRQKRQGSSLEVLGYYNPLSRQLKLDKQAAEAWVQKGAIMTETAARLVKQAPENGELIILERAQKERLSKKALDRKKQEEEAAAQAKADAEAAAQAKAEAEAAPAEEPAAEEPPAEAEAPAAEEA